MIEAPPLPRPDGVSHARIIDGVLEAWMYDIRRCEVLVRHDAVVRGERLTIAGEPIHGGNLEDGLRSRRQAALLKFSHRDEKGRAP